METYEVIRHPPNDNYGNCYCIICEKSILGNEVCFKVIERGTSYYKFVCSEECATFYILKGKE